MMNLFKKLALCACAPHLRRQDCPTTGFVYAHLTEDIFLRLKFTELRETRFDNVRRLTFKCIWRGTFEIKLIVAMVMDDVNDEQAEAVATDTDMCTWPTKRFDIRPNDRTWILNSFGNVRWFTKDTEYWNLLNIESLRVVKDAKTKRLSNRALGTYYSCKCR